MAQLSGNTAAVLPGAGSHAYVGLGQTQTVGIDNTATMPDTVRLLNAFTFAGGRGGSSGAVELRSYEAYDAQPVPVPPVERAHVDDATVVYCVSEFGTRPWWREVASDRALGVLAAIVRERALRNIPEFFGLQLDESVRFSWNGSYALQCLVEALQDLAIRYGAAETPSPAALERWRARLVQRASDLYTEEMVEWMRWQRELTFGAFNPVAVPRPRAVATRRQDMVSVVGYHLNAPNTYREYPLR